MPQLAFDILARDRASKVFDQVASKSQKTEQNLSKIGSTSGAVFGKMTAAVGGLAVGWQAWDKVMVAGFNRLANLDDARKRLDQMGLSTSEAKKLMDGLTETVTGTAFSLDAGAGAMTGFVSAGVDLDKVNSRLEMTADTAAFAQAPLDEIANIFVKIQSQGKLTAEELNMLQERGVPALVLLADAAGVTAEAMRDMISRGEIDAERFFTLWEQGSKGFGDNNIKIEGSAKSMGDTIRGSLANAETAMARLGATILDEFMPALKGLADGFKGAADAVIGFMGATEPFRDFLGDTIGQLIEVDKKIFEFLGLMEEDDPPKIFKSAMDSAKSSTEGLSDVTSEAAEGLTDVAEASDAAAESLTSYQSALKAATDPVFALHDAVSKLGKAQQDSKDASRDLKRAQEDLNELRKDSDTSTRELEDAERRVADAQKAVTDSGWGVAEALAGIEAAAVNGDLSFADFSDKLDQWVASGELTKEQADSIREKVRGLTKTAEAYSGEYVADMLAETNEGKLDKAKRELDAVARARHPKYLAELERRQEIQVRNRLDALERPRKPLILARADTARAESNLSFLARNRTATVTVNVRTYGNLEFHKGGEVPGGGVPRFHGGGSAWPRLHSGANRLASDEFPAILQAGERVLSRRQNAALKQFGRAIGAASSSSPARATAGAVTARDIRRALEGMTLMIDDKRARFTARTADLYGRAG